MRSTPLTILILISMAGGCASPLSYRSGDTPHVCRVQIGGQYNLYSCGEKYPCYAYILQAGQPLGFARDTRGHLIGLADGDRFSLPEHDYRWVRVTGNPLQTWPSDQFSFNNAYQFLFEDILTPAFVVFGILYGHPVQGRG